MLLATAEVLLGRGGDEWLFVGRVWAAGRGGEVSSFILRVGRGGEVSPRCGRGGDLVRSVEAE